MNRKRISFYRQIFFLPFLLALVGLVISVRLTKAAAPNPTGAIELVALGSFVDGSSASAEIATYDPVGKTLFVVNGDNSASAELDITIDKIDISNPANPQRVAQFDLSPYGGGANSVDFANGMLAIAIQDNNPQANGKVLLTDANFTVLATFSAGALPDMLTFTPNGQQLVVANEGEPDTDYNVDPEGSVTIITLVTPLNSSVVTQVGFADFNVGGPRAAEFDSQIRVFGPAGTRAQNLEPEYIAVSADSQVAYITLQENNAIAIINLANKSVSALKALGFKNHALTGNGFDASDRDSAINIANWPIWGMYQPDAIATFSVSGQSYLITANEGDARDYNAFSEESRIKNLTLDPTAFPNASTLRQDANLGRLNVTETLGDTDGDGDYDQLYAFGARSFSIWNGTSGALVFDSGDQLEQITAQLDADYFNGDGLAPNKDSRSDNKGPEPEAVTVGEINGRSYAFVGLERISSLVVFDVTDPQAPVFVDYVTNRLSPLSRDTAFDIAPEGLKFISAEQSPNGKPLLVTANEVSGSTTVYQINAPSIAITATVGTESGVCAPTSTITVTQNTTAYYCVTVTNRGAMTLPLHTLIAEPWGTVFEALPYNLAPQQSVNTIAAGVVISEDVSSLVSHLFTWTAYQDSAVRSADVATTTVYVQLPPTSVQLTQLSGEWRPLVLWAKLILAFAALIFLLTRIWWRPTEQ